MLCLVVLQDLESLSEGLEGRSNNPVALLFDTLLRPNTDLDNTHPSSLRWEYDPTKAVPHVVVGRGNPGGCWQFMDPKIKTLSLDRWLELPLYSFQEWKSDQEKMAFSGHVRNSHVTSADDYGRVLCGEIAQYYSDYVIKMGLGGNFVGNAEITQINSLGKKCALLGSPPFLTSHPPFSPSAPPSPSSTASGVCLRNGISVPIALERNCTLLDSPQSPISHSSSPPPSLLSSASSVYSIYESTVPVTLEKNCTLLDSPISHSPCSSYPLSSCSSSLPSPVSPTGMCLRNETTIPMALEKLTELCSQMSEREDCGIVCNQGRALKHKWYLEGSQSLEKEVCIFSHKLVLACGVYGNPRRLDVPGEEVVEFLTYTLPEFSKICSRAAATGTVLVVGAGLSAADAVLLALKTGTEVVHVFERDPNDQKLIFSRMSKEVYPGYHHVHRLMQEREANLNYVCRARSQIAHLQDSGVTITSADGKHERWDDVKLGGVFLGSNADLSFLPEKLVTKLGGTSGGGDVDAKHNPVAVEPVSFVTEASSSLYAIGSLVGDNFVRFGVGSALGAAQHIIKSSNHIQL